MKASPPTPKSSETDEQQLDTPLKRILNNNTAPPTERTDPWGLEQQTLRDIQIVSTILQRYAQHRDLINLRGGRTIGIGELVDAMIDRCDLCALFSSEQRRGCDCGCDDRDETCQRFNEALK